MPFIDQIVIASEATPTPDATWNLVGASWDMLPAASVPTQTNFALLVSLLLTANEAAEPHELVARLHAPDGAPTGQVSANIPAASPEQVALLPAERRFRAETVLAARGVVISEYGLHQLAILWDGEPLREPMAIDVVRPGDLGD